jgi:anti-anti-sigma factor
MVRPTTFEVTERIDGQTCVLSIVGELDLGTITELARRVQEKLDENFTVLRVDLSDLTFMDSSGLRELIDLYDRSRREAWRLTLIPSEHAGANTVMRVTGADAALPFEDSTS